MGDALEELRAELVRRLETAQADGVPASPEEVVRVLTADWVVQRKRDRFRDAHGAVRNENLFRDRGGDPGPVSRHEPLIYYAVRTPPRVRTDAERARDDLRHAVAEWGFSNREDPPPPHTSINSLLKGRTWWMPKGQQPVRLVDMTPAHRKALLGFLRDHAGDLHATESSRFLSAPDGIFEEFCAQRPLEWLHEQPLVKRLSKLVRADNRKAGRGQQ